MPSVVEAKVAVGDYRRHETAAAMSVAVDAAGSVIARECGALGKEFFQCYSHKFQLNHCTDEATTRLLRCQARVSDMILEK